MRFHLHVPHEKHKYSTLVSHMYHRCTISMAHLRCQINALHECQICTTHESYYWHIGTQHVPKEWQIWGYTWTFHVNGKYNMPHKCSAWYHMKVPYEWHKCISHVPYKMHLNVLCECQILTTHVPHECRAECRWSAPAVWLPRNCSSTVSCWGKLSLEKCHGYMKQTFETNLFFLLLFSCFSCDTQSNSHAHKCVITLVPYLQSAT